MMCEHCSGHQEHSHEHTHGHVHAHDHTHDHAQAAHDHSTNPLVDADDQTFRVAITGKGGVGKSTLAGALATQLAAHQEVIAVDADPDMNLATTIGCGSPTPLSERDALIKQRSGDGGLVRMNPEVTDLISDCSTSFGEYGKLITVGAPETAGTGCLCPEQNFLQAFIDSALDTDVTILDMEAGIEHLSRGTAESVDAMVAVVGPSQAAVDTVDTITSMADDLEIESVYAVLNKIQGGQRDQIANQIDIPIIETIPHDEEIIDAALSGRPPVQESSRLQAAADHIISAIIHSKKH